MHLKTHLLAAAARQILPGIIFMAPASIEDLQARIAEIDADNADILAACEARGDEADFTEEEAKRVEDNAAEKLKLERLLKIRQQLTPSAQPAQGQGRRTHSEPQNRGEEGQQRRPLSSGIRDRRGGFSSFGEFALAVRSGSIQGNTPDQRLMNAATTYGNEGTGADGGFLVPPEFSQSIWEKVMAEENLLNRCAPLQTGTNSMMIPKDETTPWQSSGGIQVYWEGEAASIPASKPSFEMGTLRLSKLTALVPIAEELLEDAIGLESWLRAKAPAKMASKINTGIVTGTGVGQPLGILKAPSLISVAKNVSQPADTIWFENITNMWARMYAPWRRNAIWLINQDIEPQLDRMAFDPQATSKVPVYLPPTGAAGEGYATLKNRPVVPIEACSTIGDQGDIILVDLQQYWALTKATQGIKVDTSMHLYFDQALMTFRFIFRLNGQPAWSAAITPQNGTMTRSWAVTLDAR